jgi:hypothetical protein
MIDTSLLRGIIARRRLSQAAVARELGITPKTFYSKMKKGVFGSDEMMTMVELLQIRNPEKVFFCRHCYTMGDNQTGDMSDRDLMEM